MSDVILEERVIDLEGLMAEFLQAQARTQLQVEQTSREMREFKNNMERHSRALDQQIAQTQLQVEQTSREMREFKDNVEQDSREFKDNVERDRHALNQQIERTQLQVEQTSREIREFKDNVERDTREFKDNVERDTREFKDNVERDTREFKDNLEQDRRALNREMARLSNKMGTLAEDLVAPSIPRILQEVVNCPEPPAMLGVRIRKRLPDGRSQEYDVVAICGDYLLINETKSRLRPEDIPAFVGRLQEVRTFLPEYADKQIVGALATFYVDPSLITHVERQGLIMLGVVDGLMQVLNTAAFQPQVY